MKRRTEAKRPLNDWQRHISGAKTQGHPRIPGITLIPVHSKPRLGAIEPYVNSICSRSNRLCLRPEKQQFRAKVPKCESYSFPLNSQNSRVAWITVAAAAAADRPKPSDNVHTCWTHYLWSHWLSCTALDDVWTDAQWVVWSFFGVLFGVCLPQRNPRFPLSVHPTR